MSTPQPPIPLQARVEGGGAPETSGGGSNVVRHGVALAGCTGLRSERAGGGVRCTCRPLRREAAS